MVYAYCPKCEKRFDSDTSVLKHLNNPRSSCISWLTELARLLATDNPEAAEYQAAYRRLSSRPARRQGQHSFPEFAGQEIGADRLDHVFYEDSHPEHGEIIDEPCAGFIYSGVQHSDVHVESYPDAARIYGRGQSFMDIFDADQHADKRKDNLFYPFASADEWEVASFLMRSSLNMKELDEFFALKLVRALQVCVLSPHQQRVLDQSTGSIVQICQGAALSSRDSSGWPRMALSNSDNQRVSNQDSHYLVLPRQPRMRPISLWSSSISGLYRFCAQQTHPFESKCSGLYGMDDG